MHHALTLHSRVLARHPFLQHLAAGDFSPPVVAWAYRRRKTIVNSFVPLLIRARAMAEQAGRSHLRRALHHNISDEQGLDPETGLPTGRGSHPDWAAWFLAALNHLDPPGNPACPFNEVSLPVWELLPTSEADGLAMMVGMAIAVEKSIPIEFQAFLTALTRAFPSLEDPARPEQLIYLVDHIEHDAQRHLPDLIDGFLGRPPGSRGDQVGVDAIPQAEADDLICGITRVFEIRCRFYDQLLQVTGTGV